MRMKIASGEVEYSEKRQDFKNWSHRDSAENPIFLFFHHIFSF